MNRISRFLLEGREKRVEQFVADTQTYLDELNSSSVSKKFLPTLKNFNKDFSLIKNEAQFDEIWAEKALTWANILQHRSKLA